VMHLPFTLEVKSDSGVRTELDGVKM
jgi:hypothetical protein